MFTGLQCVELFWQAKADGVVLAQGEAERGFLDSIEPQTSKVMTIQHELKGAETITFWWKPFDSS